MEGGDRVVACAVCQDRLEQEVNGPPIVPGADLDQGEEGDDGAVGRECGSSLLQQGPRLVEPIEIAQGTPGLDVKARPKLRIERSSPIAKTRSYAPIACSSRSL